jgi:hypothetical protein
MNAPFPAETASTAEPVADKALIDLDARLAFLQRASARCALVELNEIDIERGFDELIAPFFEIVFPRPQNDAEAYWDIPSWRQAAIEYHQDRKRWGRQ